MVLQSEEKCWWLENCIGENCGTCILYSKHWCGGRKETEIDKGISLVFIMLWIFLVSFIYFMVKFCPLLKLDMLCNSEGFNGLNSVFHFFSFGNRKINCWWNVSFNTKSSILRYLFPSVQLHGLFAFKLSQKLSIFWTCLPFLMAMA